MEIEEEGQCVDFASASLVMTDLLQLAGDTDQVELMLTSLKVADLPAGIKVGALTVQLKGLEFMRTQIKASIPLSLFEQRQ